jgi:uncharacterized damage-inducible protein DinB
MTADDARTHLRYSGWASGKLLDAALRLEPEQLHREMSVSHKSVFDTLEHIHMADRVWLFRVLGAAPESPNDPLEVAWPRTQASWGEWADTLTDADMTRVISYKSLKGDPFQSAVWQIVLHVVNHATLHRGQVMAMFRQLGVPPPPTDLIVYYREVAA